MVYLFYMARKAETAKLKTSEANTSFFNRYFAELIIFLFTVIIYCNSLGNKYNLDDELVTNNHRLTSKGISAIPEIFTSPYYADNMGYAYEYRPIVLVSFAIEHSIFGDSPGVSHFFNLLFYLLCCVTLYKTLLLIFKDKSKHIILAITLIFAAHPAHTEVVASIKNRDEILGFIFSLLALNTAFRGVANHNKLYFLLSGFCFFLALISKVTFIPFFVIIPLAIILFTDAGFASVVLLTLCFVLPAYLVIDIGQFSRKLAIEILLCLSILVFYILYRPFNFSRIFSGFGLPTTANETQQEGAFSGYQNWLKHLTPPRGFLSFQIIPPLIFGLIGVWGLYLFNSYLIAGAELLLFIMLVFGKEKMAYWAKLALYAFITVALIYLNIHNRALPQNLLVELLLIMLTYDIFFGQSIFRIFAALLFVALYIGVALKSYQTADFIIVLLVMSSFKWRKGKWLVLAFATLLVIILVSTLVANIGHPNYFWKIYLLSPLLLGTLAVIYFGKGAKPFIWACTFLLGVLVILFLPPARNNNINIGSQLVKIDSAGQQLDVKLYKGKTERPLAYIEDPLHHNNSFAIQAGTSFQILFHYLYKVILPYPLAFYYGYKFIHPESLLNPVPLAGIICYAILLIVALLLSKKRNISGFGIWVYLISISVYSDWVAPVPGLLADRFLLVPSLGWCIVAVALVVMLWNRLQPTEEKHMLWSSAPKPVKLSFVILLSLYSVLTFSRNFDWHDHLTLMQHDIDYVNESAQGNNLLGLNLMKYSITIPPGPEQVALWNKAIQHFKRSLEIYPNTFNVAFDIGRVYSGLNKPDSALVYYQLAEQIMPEHKLPSLNTNIARMFTQLGKPDSANIYFEKYIAAKPDDFEGYNNLALSYFQSGNIPKSIEVSRRAQKQMPDNYRAPYNIAQAYMATNQRDSALFYLYLAQKLNTTDPNVAQAINRIRR